MFFSKSKNFINSICLSVVAVCSNSSKLSEVLTSEVLSVGDFFASNNADFGWVSNNFGNNSNADSLYLFAYIWLSIVFFLVYLNVGLATLLFLLEAGLLSPIAAMALLNALPLSSILFFLNAITMESVVGVIVVLSYSKDWAVRDFTKYEVLESNTISTFLLKKKEHSWSSHLLFNFYYLMNFLISNLKYLKIFIKVVVFSSSFYLFKNSEPLYFIWDRRGRAFTYTRLEVDPNNIFFKLGAEYKQNQYCNNILQKSPITNKFFEFSGGGGLHYLELFSNVTDLNILLKGIPKFNNFDYFKFKENTKILEYGNRWSNVDTSKFTLKDNPNNLINNLTILSGIYFDGSFVKKNSSFLNNFNKNSLDFRSSAFNGNGLLTNLNKNLDTRLAYDILDHEKRCRNIAYGFNTNKNSENSLDGISKYNIFKLSNYASLLSKNFKNFASISSMGTFIENSLMSSAQGYGNFEIAAEYLNKNLFLNYNESSAIVNKKINFNVDYREKKYHNVNFNAERVVLVTTQHHSKNKYLFNISKNLKLINKLDHKFSRVGKFLTKINIQANPLKFQSEILEKGVGGSARYLETYFFSKKSRLISNKVLTNQWNTYTPEVFLTFKYDFGQLEWGSKNKISIFDIKSKNLPWFDYANDDEYFIDKSSEVLFNGRVGRGDLLKFEKSNASLGLVTKVLDRNISRPENESKILKWRGMFKRKKIGSRKLGFRSKSLIRDQSRTTRLAQKKKIWKIRLNWSYNSVLENLYSFQNKNINTFFLENKTFIKRLGNVNNESLVLDYRQLSKFGSNKHNNSIVSINSNQSHDFGLFDTNSGDLERFLTGGGVGYTRSYEKFNNNRIFSFKESQRGTNKINNFSIIGKQLNKKHGDSLYSNSLGMENSSNYANVLNGSATGNLFLTDSVESGNGSPIYESGGEFFKKLKIFWNNSSDITNQYHNYKNKKIVDSRFLNTFKKMVKNRNGKLVSELNRLDITVLSNGGMLKIMQNNPRMSILGKTFNKLTENFTSETYNMLPEIENKVVLTEDSEVYENLTRSGYKKPHTVYGILWDEYLKSTYGFSLNFIDLNNKINTDYSEKQSGLNKTGIWNKNFSKNIEEHLNVNDKQTGLTLDSNLGNEITARFLPKIGFYKVVEKSFNLEGQSFFFLKKNKKYIKNLKVNNSNSSFKDKKKIKKYFKKVLLKNTVEKAGLSKKSINYIKKFSEIPTGLKYDSIDIGQKLPYVKKNVISINESIYSKNKAPKPRSWITTKNNQESVTNRILTSKKSKIKTILNGGGGTGFKKREYQKLLLRSSNLSYRTFVDLQGKHKLKSNGPSRRNGKLGFLFFDKNISNYYNNDTTGNTKRSLETTKLSRNLEFTNRFGKVNRTTANLFKKNRSKRFKNFNLFLRSSLSKNHVSGGSSFYLYADQQKLDIDIFFKNMFEIRSNKNFDNYNVFESRPVKQVRSFENKNYYQIKNNQKSNYVNFRNLTSFDKKIKETWNKPGLIKNYRVDLNHFESTMNDKNYNNGLISENYKIKNIDKSTLVGFEKNNFLSLTNKNKINIFLTKNNESSEFSEFYKTKVKFDEVSYLKNKKFSGLVDYTTSFNLGGVNQVCLATKKKISDSSIFLKKNNKIKRFFNRKRMVPVVELFHKKRSIKVPKDFFKFREFPKIKINAIVDYKTLVLVLIIKFFKTMPVMLKIFYIMLPKICLKIVKCLKILILFFKKKLNHILQSY